MGNSTLRVMPRPDIGPELSNFFEWNILLFSCQARACEVKENITLTGSSKDICYKILSIFQLPSG